MEVTKEALSGYQIAENFRTRMRLGEKKPQISPLRG
jgi:hypothetical protein